MGWNYLDDDEMYLEESSSLSRFPARAQILFRARLTSASIETDALLAVCRPISL